MTLPTPGSYRVIAFKLRYTRLRLLVRSLCDATGLGSGNFERICCAIVFCAFLGAVTAAIGIIRGNSIERTILMSLLICSAILVVVSRLLLHESDLQLRAKQAWLAEVLPHAKEARKKHKNALRIAREEELTRLEREKKRFGYLARLLLARLRKSLENLLLHTRQHGRHWTWARRCALSVRDRCFVFVLFLAIRHNFGARCSDRAFLRTWKFRGSMSVLRPSLVH
jgi:hypothetical protein